MRSVRYALFTVFLFTFFTEGKGQQFTFKVNCSIIRSWRSLNPIDSSAEFVKEKMRDPYEKPTVSFKLGIDIGYSLNKAWNIIGAVNLLNYRSYGKKPDVYVDDPIWVGGKMILGGKYYYNYLYAQLGVGIEYKLPKPSFSISARMNGNFPITTIYTTKRGSYPEGKTVGRGIIKNPRPQINLSPELKVEKDFKLGKQRFAASISAEWFLLPVHDVPIQEYPILYGVGLVYYFSK